MSYLIFCSAEIGGLPYLIADVLNRNGIKAYYISLSGRKTGHDTTTFHFGNKTPDWNLSSRFKYQSVFPHRIDNIIYSEYLITKTLQKLKKEYNFTDCFATGIKSFLLRNASLEYNYWSYGSDLDKFCFSLAHPVATNSILRTFYNVLFNLKVKPNARQSIISSNKIMIAPYQKKHLDRIQKSKAFFFLPHIIETGKLENILQQKKKAESKLHKQYNSELIFFSSTRHEWHGDLKAFDDNKGNDILIRAFSIFLKTTDQKNAKLILINKGNDVDNSKSLSADLNIEDNLVWLEQMPRHMLQMYYLGATLAFGQFHTPVLTYASLEPLAAATPTISYYGLHNGRIPFYPTAPPLLNSKNPDEIAREMCSLITDMQRYRKIQKLSFNWIEKNCSEEAFCKTFLTVFNKK